MFRIFKRKRDDLLESRTSKRYLLYATGELMLVIFGILIALQINNWNEERIEQNEIREHALSLQILTSIRQAEEMASYIRDRSVDEMDNAELFFLSTHIGYRPYAWNRAALEQLKSAGGLRQMRNRVLAERISDYDALTHHLDQDYREDEEWSRAIIGLMQQLVNLNYDPEGLEDTLFWVDGYTTDDIERRLTRFRDTDEFIRLNELQWPLMSEDLSLFQRLANINREFADNARARPRSELPRLREMAAEIQSLIEQEYR
jgi:hypothetical protein